MDEGGLTLVEEWKGPISIAKNLAQTAQSPYVRFELGKTPAQLYVPS